MVLSASVESEGKVVVKTSWILVEFSMALEADDSFCYYPCMKCSVWGGGGRSETGFREDSFWDLLKDLS